MNRTPKRQEMLLAETEHDDSDGCSLREPRTPSRLDVMKPYGFGLLSVLLCSGCDPAATLLIRAQVPSGQEAKDYAVTELKNQRFEFRPQQKAEPSCRYMWRNQTESTYPRASWTTYADVCASDTALRVRISDYPRFTLSPETVQLRDHMKKSLAHRFSNIDVVVE